MAFSLIGGLNDALDAIWKEDFYGDYFEHLERKKESYVKQRC